MKEFLLLALVGFTLPATAQMAPTVIGTSPARNALTAPRGTNVTITFSQTLNGNAATSLGALKVFSSQRGGKLPGVPAVSGNMLSFAPTREFKPGEVVSVSTTTAVQSATGQTLARPSVYQFTAAVAGGTGNFTGSNEVVVGDGAAAIITADVDGDGDLDLLTPCYFDDAVSVRFNDGRGLFGSIGTEVPVGAGPQDLTVADLDGDGDLDLVTANYRGYSVSVRFNLGNGTFGGGSDFVVGRATFSVATADVDGDGDLDLLAANPNSGTVSVRLNNGAGSFSGNLNVLVGTTNDSVEAADVDNDGDIDIVSADLISNTVNVRLNTGLGTYSGGSNPVVGASPVDLRTADLDGDGDLDLLTANRTANSVSVRLNNGQGQFSGGTDVPVGPYTSGLTLGDVDGDGDLDLLTANLLSSQLSVRLNNGNGIFTAAANVSAGSNPSSVTLADIDNDGDLDLLSTSSNRVSIHFNAGTGPVLGATEPIFQSVGAVYPNPAHARTTVQVQAMAGVAQATLTLTDVLGRVVRTKTAGLPANGLRQELDLTDLVSGLYALRVQAGAAYTVHSLVVE